MWSTESKRVTGWWCNLNAYDSIGSSFLSSCLYFLLFTTLLPHQFCLSLFITILTQSVAPIWKQFGSVLKCLYLKRWPKQNNCQCLSIRTPGGWSLLLCIHAWGPCRGNWLGVGMVGLEPLIEVLQDCGFLSHVVEMSECGWLYGLTVDWSFMWLQSQWVS